MNCRKVCAATLVFMALGVVGAFAESVEIFRNSQRYVFDIDLPLGLKFSKSGIDRYFSTGGVDGNFRLIQDEYRDCANLTAERKANKLKDGFADVLAEKNGRRECYVKLRNKSTGQLSSSFYIYMNKCSCYSAFHLSSSSASSASRNKILQSVLDQIRSNNGSTRSKIEVSSNADGAEKKNANEVGTKNAVEVVKETLKSEKKQRANPGSDEGSPLGVWNEIGGVTQIRIAPCGDSLCGVVVAVKGSKDDQSIGKTIFYNIEKSKENTWLGNARSLDGDVYEGKLTLNGNRMKTAGCVLGGVICQSADWARE